jgi:[protein-PII] uridylyltransferase
MQNEVGRLRRKFREGRAELFPAGAQLASCRELLQGYTRLIDELVHEIYKFSCADADRQAGRKSHSGLAIVATGGYGRGELSPFSDIDIAFVPSEEEDPWVEAAVHMAFRLVMDVFLSFREIHVGYSFRPVSEASTWDLATRTSLLDARFLCGDRHLADKLLESIRRVSSPLDILLEIEAQQKRTRVDPEASLYSVEPNLKDSPGSLRDLHRGRWIYKLLLRVEDSALFPALADKGFLTADEIARIHSAAEWFWRARNWLHLTSGKHSDDLINNYQDRIARELDDRTSQAWLSEHYRHAEALAHFRDSAVRSTLRGPLDVGGILLRDGLLHCSNGPSSGDGSVVRMFHLSQRYRIPIALDDLQRFEDERIRAAKVTEASGDESWAFLSILREKRQVSATLRHLSGFGLMDRFIAGFSDMMRFVPPDPAHRYTVGEHSMKIIEHMEDLLANRGGPGSHRFAELLGQCSHFDVLCLAALLHDSGKMIPGQDHSEAALDLTRSVGSRLDLAPEKRELLEILVRQHLLLMRTARLQDLKSPGVIHSVADQFPTIDALRHLYVFSYLDTRAVAEKNWTSMDYRDLEELYQKVQDVLRGHAGERGKVAVEDRLGQIRRRLAAHPESRDPEAVQRHCDAMPASYVLNTPLEEITFHLQLLNRLEAEKAVLDIYNRPGDDYSEMTICTYDDPQPGMLAKITGVLYGCNVDIHKAQVFTLEKERPVVLDTLWLRSGGMQVSENRAARIRAALKEILTGGRTVEQFLRSAGKQPPNEIPLDSVELRNDLSEEHTVVHIVARDLQGLLYLMTRALSRSGLHIHSAKVATWNARAENNFYVTTLTGGQIPESHLAQWKNQLTRIFRGLTTE